MKTEADTRAEYIDPALTAAQWGHNATEGSQILREYYFTDGRMLSGGQRGKRKFADYVLAYKNQKIAIIEAKKESEACTEGLEQVKEYAELLGIRIVYATNGLEIYRFDMEDGRGDYVDAYPTPDQLYQMIHGEREGVVEHTLTKPFHKTKFSPRYYQENAIQEALNVITNGEDRVLLTLATGTGKTFIAFQIVWKLFQARWNRRDDERRPRVLFLADRNVLIEQAMGDFNSLEKEIIRIDGEKVRQSGGVPTSAHIFFSIYQAMTGGGENPYYKDYPEDFFDLIIIDECHRGAAEDGNWRAVLTHFTQATHVGLTATPKRDDNVDTYNYFGEPRYVYSLREGIEDGFLTPFKVKKVSTTLDDYRPGPGDVVLAGEVEKDEYGSDEMNRTIIIPEREEAHVKIMLHEIDQSQKTIIFCHDEAHALMVRDFINKHKESNDPNYCVRVTASEGTVGDQWLRVFRDNEKTIPTILTTSQKLSTGVDARNLRFVVLMRSVGSMVEFKQIVGRGTRVYEGKDFFTIVDFYDNYEKFDDPEWDGEAVRIEEGLDRVDNEELKKKKVKEPKTDGSDSESEDKQKKEKICIQLAPHRTVFMDHMIETLYFDGGRAVTPEQFLKELFAKMPDFFVDENALREIWSQQKTRANLLDSLADSGFELDKIITLRDAFDAKDSDVYDFLRFLAFDKEMLSRNQRINQIDLEFLSDADGNTKEFIKFVIDQYCNKGFEELSDLSNLVSLKFGNVAFVEYMGGTQKVKQNFARFQQEVYRS